MLSGKWTPLILFFSRQDIFFKLINLWTMSRVSGLAFVFGHIENSWIDDIVPKVDTCLDYVVAAERE